MEKVIKALLNRRKISFVENLELFEEILAIMRRSTEEADPAMEELLDFHGEVRKEIPLRSYTEWFHSYNQISQETALYRKYAVLFFLRVNLSRLYQFKRHNFLLIQKWNLELMEGSFVEVWSRNGEFNESEIINLIEK